MTKCIVYTRDEDQGVSLFVPSHDIFTHLAEGWPEPKPRGFVEQQTERQIASGIKPDVAYRHAKALAFGGLTGAEAWGHLRDRTHNPAGHLHEMQDGADLPDRWFRNAWRRSANGGPVVVNLDIAKPRQWVLIKAAVKTEERRREMDLDLWRKPLDIPWLTIERAIRHSRDTEELRRVWPVGLAA